MRGNERGGRGPQWLVHTPMSKILKNTLIEELICLAGAATQMFAAGSKHPRAATAINLGCPCILSCHITGMEQSACI